MADTTVARFRARSSATPDGVALHLLASGGSPREETLTWKEWEVRVDQLALALLAEGLAPGERVAVLAGNGLLWPIADLAILSAGGVSVGAYPTSTPEQLRHTLTDSEATLVFVDTRERCERLLEVRDQLPALRTIVCAEEVGSGVETLEPWLAERAGPSSRSEKLESRTAALRPDDPAVIVYTSGSTGIAKGAVLSHGYLVASADSIAATLGLVEGDSSLSLLPYAHASERIFGLHTRITAGVTAGVVMDPRLVWEAAADFHPTVLGGIPRMFEKAAERLEAARQQLGGAEGDRWDRAIELGLHRSRLRQAGEAVPPRLEEEWREAGAQLFAAVDDIFGNRLRVASSGGAPLPRQAAELLDAAGVTVLGAYGLTEHLCVAFNRPDRYTFDTAGPPMPGTELRIEEDGEILVRRCALTFSEYLHRPEETAATFTGDGTWLRTGDLGELDERGFLRVTGRKKELIALSTGKKVAPAPIEEKLRRHPRIANAVVCGEGRKHLSALVFLRGDHDGTGRPDGPVCRDPSILAEIDAVVKETNSGVPRYEQVARYLAIEREPSEEMGELTDTMKIRRDVIADRFRERIDALYREDGS